MITKIEEALINICQEKHGDTEITWNGNADNYDSLDNVKRIDGKDLKFTWEEVLEEKTKLVTEHAAQEYARNRVEEYPSIGDQLDMMYKDNKNSTTTHAAAVEAVKTKWPKDNSGPVE